MDGHDAKDYDWRAILSIGLSGLGIVLFLIQALSFGVLWLTNLSDPQGRMDQTILYGLLGWSGMLSVLMLLPVFLLNFYQLRGQEPPKWLDARRPAYRKIALWSILLWPVFVAAGWTVAGSPVTAAFLLGPINILVAGLPVLWIYTSATRGLKRGLQIRQWRIFGLSLTVTPVIIIILEILALLILGGMGMLYVSYRASGDPTLERDLTYIYNQIAGNQADIDFLIEFFEPYLLQPGVIVWGLVVFAGVVPIIEEIIKPIALWPMAGLKISPQEGFVGGLLTGAGFALMENVLYFTASITAMDWITLAVGRASTGVLHMLASGLVGWGLARMWRDGKRLFLAGMTLLAIILHGLWNAIALVTGAASLFMLESEAELGQVILYNLPTLVLFLISVVSIVLINRHFQKRNNSNSSIREDEEENQNQDLPKADKA